MGEMEAQEAATKVIQAPLVNPYPNKPITTTAGGRCVGVQRQNKTREAEIPMIEYTLHTPNLSPNMPDKIRPKNEPDCRMAIEYPEIDGETLFVRA